MTPIAALQQQDRIARMIAELVGDTWLRIVINYECQVGEEDSFIDNIIAFALKRQGNEVATDYLKLPLEISQEFLALRDLLPTQNDQRWNTCDLVIDHTGRYRFDFFYDPPKRINGILDEQSYDRFTGYAEKHREELEHL